MSTPQKRNNTCELPSTSQKRNKIHKNETPSTSSHIYSDLEERKLSFDKFSWIENDEEITMLANNGFYSMPRRAWASGLPSRNQSMGDTRNLFTRMQSFKYIQNKRLYRNSYKSTLKNRSI